MQRFLCSSVLPRIARPSLAPVPSDSIAGQKSGCALTAEEAVTLIGTTSDTCAQLKQNIERLFDFVHTATDTDALRKEIASLQQQLENQKSAHEEEVKTLQQKADEANATMLKANREQLPKKKVIPYSVLDAVPLLGKGVMTGLVPVLAKYNIVVDYNR